ncbi:MAG: PKD domain-containing protein [Bacteroidota bacterium]
MAYKKTYGLSFLAFFQLCFCFSFAKDPSGFAYINANFRHGVACAGQHVQFFDETLPEDNDKLVSWFWSFGDNSAPSVSQDPIHLYKYPGEYTVSLHVITASGAKGSFSKIVIVSPVPSVEFSSNTTSVCVGQPLKLVDGSALKEGQLSEWKWEFGDGSSSTAVSPVKSYSSPGSYDVALTVISEDGCSARKTHEGFVQVNPRPIADFAVSTRYPTMINPTVNFVAAKNSDIKQYIWYFGDGDSLVSGQSSVTHDYPNTESKSYRASLVVINASGCSDTMVQEITVNPEFTFYMPNAFTPNGDGINELFSGTGMGIVEYEITVFNKKGVPVFYSDDIDKKWDGNDIYSENQPVPDGVYAWVVNVTDAFGKKHKYMGHVNVIR